MLKACPSKFLVGLITIIVGSFTISNAIAQPALAIDSIVNKAIEGDNFSGSILLAKNGEIVYSKTAGYADREMQKPFDFQTTASVASVGKLFTAVVIAKLYESGKIDLSKPINYYLPATRIKNAGLITIEHLLNHTSGLGNYLTHPSYRQLADSSINIERLLRLVEEVPNAHLVPGSMYEYSNSGYIVLGRITEVLTGVSYERAVIDWVVNPASIKAVNFSVNTKAYGKNAKGYLRHRQGNNWDFTQTVPPLPSADGGVYTTATDLYKFDKALYAGKLIGLPTLNIMQNRLVDAVLPGIGKTKYGCGLMRFDYEGGAFSFGHNGGCPGYTCEYRHYFLPDKTQYTLIIMSNYDRAIRPILFEIQSLILDKTI